MHRLPTNFMSLLDLCFQGHEKLRTITAPLVRTKFKRNNTLSFPGSHILTVNRGMMIVAPKFP